MENLTILSTNISVQAKQEIGGNTVEFSWNNEQGKKPTAISFNAKRGVNGSEGYTGNNFIFGSFYPEIHQYDFNNSAMPPGDEDLYTLILAVCKEIVQAVLI